MSQNISSAEFWKKCFSTKRLNEKSSKQFKQNDNRSPFQKDYDRIIFSSFFRHLQDKTQVIPFPESDFIHTRLTHSLETSCVGRSLGLICGEEIIQKISPESESSDSSITISPIDIAFIVSSACLVHDIGNPPFGHSGEEFISTFFQENESKYLTDLSPEEKQQFLYWEGNASGFHIIVNDQQFNLTYATLSAFTKYPWSADDGRCKDNSKKKYGFLSCDKQVAKEIFSDLGLIHQKKILRHPLSLLVEAADDICYGILDMEDAFHAGIIDFSFIENNFRQIIHLSDSKKTYYEGLNENSKISYLRSNVIHELINHCSSVFKENILKIENIKDWGRLNLLDTVKKKNDNIKKALDNIMERAEKDYYNSKKVVEEEIYAKKILSSLLDTFLSAIWKPTPNHYEEKVKKLIDPNYLPTKKDTPYKKLLKITSFISNMTDSYAKRLYEKL